MIEIRLNEREGVAVIELEGRLDITSSPQLESSVDEVFDSGQRALVIDCSKLKYISSSGLRVLLIAARKFSAAGGRLVLCGVAGHIRKIFDISGFSSIFTIKDTQEEAVNG
jgi:anti-anti-sigma factor